MDNNLKKLHEIIKKSKSAALVGHIRPDGDCIGSCIAMKLALGHGDIYIDGEIPQTFAYMPDVKNINNELTDKKYDLMIIMDCADENRLGKFTELRSNCKTVIAIDHHLNTTTPADLYVTDKTRASTGSILYEFFKSAKIEITHDMAVALYTAIASDTGCFMFSNTKSFEHRAVADLIDIGIDTEKINYHNFRVYQRENLPALIHVLKNIQLFHDGKISVIHLPYKTIKKLNIENDFRHKFQKYGEDMEGVAVSATISEKERGKFHVSIRSHGDVNISTVCEIFGGGGHRNAAGFVAKGKYRDIMDRLLIELKKVLP